MSMKMLQGKIATYGIVLSIFTIFSAWALAQHSKTWKLTPQRLELPRGTLEIVLGDPTAEHWAVGIVSVPDSHGAEVSAGTVSTDGPFIESVKDLDSRRLEIKPGGVHIQRVSGESGLAVCAGVPAGTDVRILRGEQLVARSTTGVLVADGEVLVRSPKLCTSILAVRRAMLRSGIDKLE